MLLWAQLPNLHLLQWHKLDQPTDDGPGLLFAHLHLFNIKAAGQKAAWGRLFEPSRKDG